MFIFWDHCITFGQEVFFRRIPSFPEASKLPSRLTLSGGTGYRLDVRRISEFYLVIRRRCSEQVKGECHQLSLLCNSLLDFHHPSVRTFPFRPRLGLTPPSVHLVVTTNAASFVHPSRTICVAWLWFETISGLVLFICVETVLVIRGQRPFPDWKDK